MYLCNRAKPVYFTFFRFPAQTSSAARLIIRRPPPGRVAAGRRAAGSPKF